MEHWLLFLAGLSIILLLIDIRSRLPKSKQASEMNYLPIADGGYLLFVRHVIARDFEVGFNGVWRLGRSFDIVGDLIPYHHDYVPQISLDLKKQQTIHFFPESTQIERTRLGWPSRVSKDRPFDCANVFLPVDIHQKLFDQLQGDAKWVIELLIGEDERKRSSKELTYGIYRLTLREAEFSELSRLGEQESVLGY